jgi:hypothetical protein
VHVDERRGSGDRERWGIFMIGSQRERMVKLATRIAELREALKAAEEEMRMLLEERHGMADQQEPDARR